MTSEIQAPQPGDENVASFDPKGSWEDSRHNPVNWSPGRKWLVTLVCSVVVFAAGLNASSILSAASALGEEFGYSDDAFPMSYWTVTSWTMGGAVGPMLGMPLLEEFGVRRGYLVCYVGFTLFLIPQAVAQNFATLIVTRFFAGFFSSILQNGMASVISDIFASDIERGLPTALFIFVYLAGFTLGPAYGACFAAKDWRWIFYAHLIAFGGFSPVVWFTFRETRGHLIKKALSFPGLPERKEAASSSDDVEKVIAATALQPSSSLFHLFYDAIVRPIILVSTQPIIFVITLWSAFATALVFICTESVESVYVSNFTFSERQVSIVQVSMFIGEVIGFLLCIPNNAYYARSARWNKETPGSPSPEARLLMAVPASLLGLAGGLFWYAWSSSPRLSWVLPSVGLAFVGAGIVVIVNCAVMWTTDAYTTHAGSAVAAVAMGENLLSAWVPLSTPKMYEVLGPHWASSLLGFVAVALSAVPVLLIIFGRRIRAKSDMMEGK